MGWVGLQQRLRTVNQLDRVSVVVALSTLYSGPGYDEQRRRGNPVRWRRRGPPSPLAVTIVLRSVKNSRLKFLPSLPTPLSPTPRRRHQSDYLRLPDRVSQTRARGIHRQQPLHICPVGIGQASASRTSSGVPDTPPRWTRGSAAFSRSATDRTRARHLQPPVATARQAHGQSTCVTAPPTTETIGLPGVPRGPSNSS